LVQNNNENVAFASSGTGMYQFRVIKKQISKTDVKICKTTVLFGNRITIKDFMTHQGLDYNDDRSKRAIRKAFERHRSFKRINHNCLKLKNNIYYHTPKKCPHYVGEGGVGQKNVASLTNLDNLYLPAFGVEDIPMKVLLDNDFILDINYPIEAHGMQWRGNWKYVASRNEAPFVFIPEINKYSKVTIQANFNGTYRITVGPNLDMGRKTKYAFTGVKATALRNEILNKVATIFSELIILDRIYLIDFSNDDHRTEVQVLDGVPVPIQEGAYNILLNEYGIVRYDHPIPEANGVPLRRREVRLLNQATVGIGTLVRDLVTIRREDIRNAFSIKGITSTMQDAIIQNQSVTSSLNQTANLAYRKQTNLIGIMADGLSSGLATIGKTVEEAKGRGATWQKKMSYDLLNMDSKLSQSIELQDTMNQRLNLINTIPTALATISEQYAANVLQQRELISLTRQANNDRRIGNEERLEVLGQVSVRLKELQTDFTNWKNIDTLEKKEIIGSLLQLGNNQSATSRMINKYFKVSRQAISALSNITELADATKISGMRHFDKLGGSDETGDEGQGATWEYPISRLELTNNIHDVLQDIVDFVKENPDCVGTDIRDGVKRRRIIISKSVTYLLKLEILMRYKGKRTSFHYNYRDDAFLIDIFNKILPEPITLADLSSQLLLDEEVIVSAINRLKQVFLIIYEDDKYKVE